MTRTAHRAARPRTGFTLIELLIVVSLLGIIGTMLTTIMVRQQRFHRAVMNVTDARARMRDISTIMPTDLRSISTAGGDLLVISDTSMHFRAFVGTSIMCRFQSAQVIELPRGQAQAAGLAIEHRALPHRVPVAGIDADE